jgi:uncharacterized repeat protein (TIGR01451 family)
VTNTGGGTQAYHLIAWAGTDGPQLITVDSITGLNVSRGVRPDSASIAGVAAGANASVDVWYRLSGGNPGEIQTLFLRARSTTTPSVWDDGSVRLTIGKPALVLTKEVVGSTSLEPGEEIRYRLQFSNSGRFPAHEVTIVDPLPPEVVWKLQDVEQSLPGEMEAKLAFSQDGALWVYAPVSGGCGAPAGYDACVRFIRWTFAGALLPSEPGTVGFLTFVVAVR